VLKSAAAALIGLLALGGPVGVRADFVRDEIRVNMRTGAGLRYRILKVLKSGDEVTKLGETEDWVRIRHEGQEGWIPTGYLSRKQPAAAVLPAVEEKLGSAEGKIEELSTQLAAQAQAVQELESLRARVEELQTSNARLSSESTWKTLAAGGGIVILGILIGLLIPKGRNPRSTRIRL
jgi:SH3 domain protein